MHKTKPKQLARRNTGQNKQRNKDRCRQQMAPKKRNMLEYKGYMVVQDVKAKRVVVYHRGHTVHTQTALKPKSPLELVGIVDKYLERKQGHI